MKLFRLVPIICFSIFWVTCSWSQPVVVVSEIRQVVRIAPAWRSILNEESFPDYFGQDTVLRNQVLLQVQVLLQKKWNATQVKFPGESVMQFVSTSRPVLPPPALPANRADGDIFVAIVHGIGPTTTATDAAGMPITYFTSVCMVRAEDKAGKRLWESSVTMPFGTAVKPGEAYGIAEMDKADWEGLFISSLAAALENTTKRLPSTTFYRPPFREASLAQFLQEAHRTTLHENVQDGLLYRKGEARKIIFAYGEGKEAKLFEVDQQFMGNPEVPAGLFLTKATLTNRTHNQVYEITAEFTLPEDNTASIEARKRQPISIRCTAAGLLAGRFTLTPNQFEGQWGYDVYTIRKINPKNTFEVRLNNKLIAIGQKGGMSGVAKDRSRDTYFMMDKTLDEGAVTELNTIWLIYQMALSFGQDFLDY